MQVTKKRYIATRGVSWRDGAIEVNREAGDDISDAPAAALKDWLSLEPPAAEEASAPNPKEATDG